MTWKYSRLSYSWVITVITHQHHRGWGQTMGRLPAHRGSMLGKVWWSVPRGGRLCLYVPLASWPSDQVSPFLQAPSGSV